MSGEEDMQDIMRYSVMSWAVRAVHGAKWDCQSTDTHCPAGGRAFEQVPCAARRCGRDAAEQAPCDSGNVRSNC